MSTRIVVLAGGKGKRMRSPDPKVLVCLEGRPMICRLLNAIEKSGIDRQPVVVVGWGADKVKEALGGNYEYALQETQLGTGHAVKCTQPILEGRSDAVIVLYGDQPFVNAATIAKLHQLHESTDCVMTMMTTKVDDFEGLHAPLYDFGRVVRDSEGRIARIVEKKDATPEELAIHEVNPSFFCFDAQWLWSHLDKLTDDNAQGEYYLTDLVRIAIDEGECIASMDIDPLESIGINTPEHLDLAAAL